MNDIKDLNVQPVTAFEVGGSFLITLFPSIFKGFVPVLCAKLKGNRVKVMHDCKLCRAYGHDQCPYVREGIKYFMIHKRQRFASYTILQKRVPMSPKFKQIPIPSVNTSEHQVREVEGYAAEHTSKCG